MSVHLSVKVTELLSSRLLHDLISPVSAVNNGVELIEDMGQEMLDDAMGLIRDSASRASKRLQIFRLAYGAGGVQKEEPLDATWSILNDYFSDGKIDLGWQVEEAERFLPLPTAVPKILVNSLLMFDDGLPGSVTVTMRMGMEEGDIIIEAEGRCAKLPIEMIEAVNGDLAHELELSPKTVQGYVTQLFAEQYGMTVSLRQDGDEKLMIHIRK